MQYFRIEHSYGRKIDFLSDKLISPFKVKEEIVSFDHNRLARSNIENVLGLPDEIPKLKMVEDGNCDKISGGFDGYGVFHSYKIVEYLTKEQVERIKEKNPIKARIAEDYKLEEELFWEEQTNQWGRFFDFTAKQGSIFTEEDKKMFRY